MLKGVHQDLQYWGEPYQTQDIGLAVSVHANASRSTLLWNYVEQNSGVYDWSTSDAFIGRLQTSRIVPVLYPARWPKWLPGWKADWAPPADFETAVLAYARFCAAAAHRYKGKGVRWEIWNEQNEHYSWDGADRALATRQYAVLYQAARAAIKAEIPTALVAVGGVAGLQAGSDGPGLDWIRDFLKLVPRLAVDRIAIHPYASRDHAPDVDQPFQDNFTAIQATRDLLDSLGRQDIKLWVTEFGWDSVGTTEPVQAQYLAKAFEMIHSRYPWLEMAVCFSDRDKGGTHHGLYADDYREKASANVFRQAVV